MTLAVFKGLFFCHTNVNVTIFSCIFGWLYESQGTICVEYTVDDRREVA